MSYGDGSFTRQGDKWKFRKNYRSKADGVVRRLIVSGVTQKECREKMQKKEAKIDEELRKQNILGGITKEFLYDGSHVFPFEIKDIPKCVSSFS